MALRAEPALAERANNLLRVNSVELCGFVAEFHGEEAKWRFARASADAQASTAAPRRYNLLGAIVSLDGTLCRP